MVNQRSPYGPFSPFPLLLQGRSTFSGVLLLGSLSTSYSLWMTHLDEPHMMTVIPALTLGVLALRLYQPIYQKRPEILSVFSVVALLNVLSASTFFRPLHSTSVIFKVKTLNIFMKLWCSVYRVLMCSRDS